MFTKIVTKYRSDLRIVLVAFLYYASACLGYFLSPDDASSLPSWPPSGVAFALILLLGRKAWPGIMIGALLSSLLSFWNKGTLSAESILFLAFVTAIAHTVEALMGNFLVRRWINDPYPFSKTHHAFKFLFVTMIMSLSGAVIGVCGLFIQNLVNDEMIFNAILNWWIGNAVGILLFTPFILAGYRFVLKKISGERAWQIVIAFLFALSVFIFSRFEFSNEAFVLALPFIILPILLWMGFRFELAISMGGVIVVALLSIYLTAKDIGPFILSKASDSIMLLQVFVGVISISTLVLSSTVRERTHFEEKLLEFNETLETKVHERTKELNEEISTRKRAETRLQQTNKELIKRNNELDNFVYSVSHDLRAPIASVLGLINLAKNETDIDVKNSYLDMMNKSALQQDHFIREILDQSRNARSDVKREEVFFESIIEETFNQMKFATTTGKVDRVINVRQDKPFYCDRWRLQVILNNLISNSIRYRNGKDPVVKIDVTVNHDAADLHVEDNGRGIGAEHMDNICKMFYRATDEGPGSGLGLYIVKETVDKLNGSLTIDSELGKGTSVKLRIPEVV